MSLVRERVLRRRVVEQLRLERRLHGSDVCDYLVAGQRFDCVSCNDTSGCFQASLAACK